MLARPMPQQPRSGLLDLDRSAIGRDQLACHGKVAGVAGVAGVAQHEADHLDGVLFFDRMRTFDSLTFLDEYARYWAKE